VIPSSIRGEPLSGMQAIVSSIFMGTIIEDPRLRNREGAFLDRNEAGERLAAFLQARNLTPDPVVCSIPAGGVPVGVAIALSLKVPLELAIVRKVQIPGNPEAGFGAVTWDGSVLLNQGLVQRLGLTEQEIQTAVDVARENVRAREKAFPRHQPSRNLSGHTVILTDDGLASGYTMRAAAETIRRKEPARILVAVPTGSLSAVRMVAEEADELICLNVRTTYSFAVADAYVHWHDLTDEEVQSHLKRAARSGLW
jgi:putative phosphoribosyl transferase